MQKHMIHTLCHEIIQTFYLKHAVLLPWGGGPRDTGSKNKNRFLGVLQHSASVLMFSTPRETGEGSASLQVRSSLSRGSEPKDFIPSCAEKNRARNKPAAYGLLSLVLHPGYGEQTCLPHCPCTYPVILASRKHATSFYLF